MRPPVVPLAHRHHFADRRDAGRRLAAALAPLRDADPLVLALPRGGVPVAYEVALALDAPLDVILVRKIGAPGHPEFGIGAVVDGDPPRRFLNASHAAETVPPDYLQAETARQLDIIAERRARWHAYRSDIPLAGRTVIVVDDGIATGGTMRAALQAMHAAGAARVVLAVPVAPADALNAMPVPPEDRVCLITPTPFYAVAMHYGDFAQTTDDDVLDLLERARRRSAPGRASPRGD